MIHRRLPPILTAAVVAAVLAACGGGGDDAGTTTTAAAAASPSAPAASALGAEATPALPVTLTDAAGDAVTVSSTERIIPVNGDLAEVVFALGLGDSVVATDLSATYPPEADARPEIGYQRALATEPILSFAPSVVLADELAGPPEVLDQLRGAGVPVVVIHRDRTLDGPAAKIRAVGQALGVPGRAEALARQVETGIATATSDVGADGDKPRVLALYLRGEAVQLAFGEGSGIDALIEAAGGVDVGSELGITESQPVTEESMVAARPDAILVTTSGLESVGGVDGLLEIAAIARTPAGEARRVLAYEDQYLYGFGPRTPELLTELVAALHSTPQPS